MSRPTASSFALLHACGYSFRDDVELPPSAEKSAASARGDIFGLLAEQAINGGAAPALSTLIADLPEDEARAVVAMWGHARQWLAEHKRLGWRAEVALAWDPGTDVGRELPRLAHRDYSSASLTELCGTADILAIEGDDVVVYDWKTHAPGAPDVDATDQLEGLALMAARAWGYDSARIVTLVVTEAGVDAREGTPLGPFDLQDVADRLRASVAAIPGAEPRAGDHCRARYCKALAVCPKTQEALAPALLPAAALTKRWAFTPVIESPDHLQALMQMRSMVDAASKAVGAAIATYVGDQEVVCSDGTTIKASYRTMPRMDQEALAELVKSLGGTQDQIDACVRPRLEGAGIKAYKPKKARAA